LISVRRRPRRRRRGEFKNFCETAPKQRAGLFRPLPFPPETKTNKKRITSRHRRRLELVPRRPREDAKNTRQASGASSFALVNLPSRAQLSVRFRESPQCKKRSCSSSSSRLPHTFPTPASCAHSQALRRYKPPFEATCPLYLSHLLP
jgi:hypothetical protein